MRRIQMNLMHRVVAQIPYLKNLFYEEKKSAAIS